MGGLSSCDQAPRPKGTERLSATGPLPRRAASGRGSVRRLLRRGGASRGSTSRSARVRHPWSGQLPRAAALVVALLLGASGVGRAELQGRPGRGLSFSWLGVTFEGSPQPELARLMADAVGATVRQAGWSVASRPGARASGTARCQLQATLRCAVRLEAQGISVERVLSTPSGADGEGLATSVALIVAEVLGRFESVGTVPVRLEGAARGPGGAARRREGAEGRPRGEPGSRSEVERGSQERGAVERAAQERGAVERAAQERAGVGRSVHEGRSATPSATEGTAAQPEGQQTTVVELAPLPSSRSVDEGAPRIAALRSERADHDAPHIPWRLTSFGLGRVTWGLSGEPALGGAAVSLLGARGRLRIGGSAALVGGAGSLADTRLALLRAELGPRLGVRLGGERFGVTLDGGPLLIVLWAEAEGRSVTIASGAVALAVRAEWTAWRGLLVTLGLEGQVAFSRLRVTRATDELGRVELGTLSLLVGLGWDAPRR